MTVQLNGLGANLPYAGSSPYSDGTERGSTPRIELPFPATVRGVDRHGERFELKTLLDNLSATGLYLRLARSVEPRAALFVVVRLTTVPGRWTVGPDVAARGMVRRKEPRPGGTWGLAIAFARHRFLYALTAQ
jgi:hypothetical protein